MESTGDGLESLRPSKRQRISEIEHTQTTGPSELVQFDGAGDVPSAKPASSFSEAVPVKDEQIEREEKSGITAFVSPEVSGFEGLLKKRYTDFLVHEILPNGKVLHLESTAVRKAKTSVEAKTKPEAVQADLVDPQQTVEENPAEPQHDTSSELSGVRDGNNTANGASSSAASAEVETDRELLLSTFGQEKLEEIEALYRRILNNPDRKASSFAPVKSEVVTDRELRTRAHRAIRNVFNSRLESQTKEDETMVISIAVTANRGRGGGNANTNPMLRGKLGWQELGGEYLHFTVYKENKDTMEVIYFLASQMKVNVKHFQFGGTKDRRAVTVQRASAYRVRAEQLASVNRKLRGAKIGDFEYKTTGLELGELGGNEFVISLRDCQVPGFEAANLSTSLAGIKDHLHTLVEQFKTRGFLNYYGLQRFGSFSTGTDVVGMKLLQGDLEGAIDAIMSFNPETLNQDDTTRVGSDDRARAQAIHIWNTTRNSHKALDCLPRKFSAESNIIRQLGTRDRNTGLPKKNDFQGALMSIPRNLRLMYIHAYQSLVWNTMAGKRWELCSDRIMAGDLVIVQEHYEKVGKLPEQDDVDEQGETIIRPAADDSAADPDSYTQARALTEEEASSGQYTIFDVVLPLPGYDVIYPPGAIEQEYKSFMASERGGGLDPYDMRRSWKDMSLSGGYRKLLSRPGPDMSFKVQTYVGEDEQLVETDANRLEKKNKPARNGEVANNGRSDIAEDKFKDEMANENGQAAPKLAVIVTMKLGPSQYATMALRELMKSGLKTYKPDYSGGR